jgi:FkbM family methyltransferase
MGLLKNMMTFSNWYSIYLARYGLLHDEFLLKTRTGATILVRPWAEDVRIIKSIFLKKNYVNDFVSIMPNSVVVDVGANIGAFTVFAARRAKKVFAFEPENENFSLLCANIELNDFRNVTPLKMAMTAETGKRKFHIAEKQHSGSHSFLLQRYDKEVEVKTLSIADLIAKKSIKKVNFLKLDCEGSEIEIIKGLSFETAKNIEQISLEFHQVNDYSIEDMVRQLNTLGYDVRLREKGGYIFARRRQ